MASPVPGELPGDRPLFGPAEGTGLHVMSFNLRYGSVRGPHAWARRRPVMAELLRRELPTLLGTQEGLADQLRDLDTDLPGSYERVGQGRRGGDRDEFVAVYFDTRRLTLLAHGDFWLSDTPGTPGSTSWGNTLPRMATWARFTDRRTGVELAVVNAHLDHLSENARVHGAALLRDTVDAFGTLPVVVTGDFNAPAERSDAYRILTAGLTDTWAAATTRLTPPYATFHGYLPPVPSGARIDWILTRGAAAVPAAGINTFARDGAFASDHFPVQALVELS
jgi:endonuclease/exonuclease/phosphatase family metal-dependent hydrolase